MFRPSDFLMCNFICFLFVLSCFVDAKEQLFTPGITVKRTPSKYHLEQFADFDNVEEHRDLIDLALGLHIHALWNNTVEQNWNIYAKAAANLKATLPNLRTLRLSGGHSYYPQNGSLTKLRCDFLLVQNSLDAITRQMKMADWKAGDSVNYTVFHFIRSRYFVPDDYKEILTEVFGRNVTSQLVLGRDLHAIELNYRLNGIPIYLSIETFTDLQTVKQKTQLEHGRLDYKTAAWEIAKLDIAKAKNKH
ncbi:hypothetical protein M3Y98_00641100 [Aphelenchoides besseyi]|nr:hypothetical protein M3Y98_00641100 [Aphelenchoides besseyi]KAI6208571.1 hypothetical protein M3Y96_00129200 [Aphelenchoides besseyi]